MPPQHIWNISKSQEIPMDSTRCTLREARRRTTMFGFSPELLVSPGKTWLFRPLGKGSPSPFPRACLRGAPHAASCWPREGNLCCSAVTSKLLRPQGLLRAPRPAKGSPTADFSLPTPATCSKPSRCYQQADKEALESPALSQRILLPQQEHPASLYLLWLATALWGGCQLQGLQPHLTTHPGQGQPAAPTSCGWGRSGEGWFLPPTRCTDPLLTWHTHTAEIHYYN